MAGIISDMSEDIKKLQQLKVEISNVKKELKSIDIRVNLSIKENLEAKLQSLMKQYQEVAQRIAKVEGEAMLATKRINDAINGISSDPLKSFDAELMKMCSNLNKYFDGVLKKVESLSSLLQSGTVKTESLSSNKNAPTQQIDDLRAKNTELTEQLRAQKEEIRQQQEEWNKLACSIKTNNISAIEQYKQATSSSSDTVKSAKTELRELKKDLDENIKYYDKLAAQVASYQSILSRLYAAKDKGLTRINIGDGATSLISTELERFKPQLDDVTQKSKEITSQILEQRKRQAELNTVIEQGSEKHLRTRTLIMDAREQLIQMRAAGLQNTVQYQQSAEELGRMRKQMVLVNAEMSYLSNPNKNLAVFKAGLSGMASSASLLVGVMGLVNQKNEDMLQLQTKIQSLLGIIVGLEGAYNMVKKSSILMIAIENAQRRASIASQVLEAKAKNTNIALTWSEVVAQKALNAVAKVNPYLILSAAILTVVGGMALLIKATREAKSVTKDLLSVEQEMALARMKGITSSTEELSKLKQLYNASQDESRIKRERLSAIQQLKEKYPAYFSSLSNESILAGNAATAYKNLSKQILASAKARAYSDTITENEKKILDLDVKRANAIVTRDKAQKSYDKLVEAMDGRRTLSVITAERRLNKANESLNSIISQQETYRKNNERLSKEVNIADLDWSPNNGEQSAAEKLRKQEEKYNLLLDKNKREKERQKIDSKHELEQIEIDGLQEGSEKILRQRALNHKKELEAIRREAEDKKLQLIENARSEFEANPANAKKSFNAESFIKSEPVQKQFKKIEETHDVKIKTSNLQYNRGDDLAGLFNEYKDYTDKRLDIEKKFNDDIAILEAQRRQAVKDGNTALVEQIDRAKAQATKNKGENLMHLDYEQLKKSPEYVRAFENLKQTSTETLTSLLSQLEAAKQTAAEVLNPEDLREYTSTIQSIVDELTERNPFQTIINKKKELAQAEQELAEAKKQLDDVNNGKKIVVSSHYNKDTNKIEFTYLTAAEALKKYNKAKDHVVKTDSELQVAEKKVSEQVDELGNALKNIGGVIGGTSGEIISLMGDIYSFTSLSMEGVGKLSGEAAKEMSALEKASVILGIISAAIQLLQQLDSLIGDAHSQYEGYAEKIAEINKLTDAVNEYRIAALEAQQAEKDWFSEDKLGNLRDFRELHEEIANAYDEKANEKQAVYQNESGGGWLTKTFNWVMGNMSLLSPLKGWRNLWGQGDYDKNTTEAINNLRIETRKKSKGFLGTGIGGHSQKTEDLVTWARNNGFGELFEDDGLINKEAGKAILDKYGDKLVGQTKETLESLVELREKYDEYFEQLHEYVNSLYEPLVDNFVDGIWDWLNTGKDALSSFREYASDTFKNIANDMIKSIVLSKIFGEGENSYQNKINKAYDDYAKGLIDEVELNRQVTQLTSDLMSNAEEQLPVIQGMSENIAKTIKDTTGIDITNSESSSQSSTSGGFQSMSQDSADELNGRFTALQMTGEEIKSQNIMQTDLLSSINEKMSLLDLTNEDIPALTSDIPNIADQTRESIISSYLPQVNIIFPDTKIDILTTEVSTLRNTIEDMQRMQAEGLLNEKDIISNTGIIAKNSPKILSNTDEIKRDIKNI